MYLVEISKTAYKAPSKLSNSIAEEIEDALLALEENPRLQKSKKLVGFKDLYRIRVSDYRAFH